MRTNRRLAALVGAAALAATTLSACGSSDDGDSGDKDGASSTWTPVTIESKFGTATIDEKPERVVTIGLTDQDAVLALGTVPVAVTNWFGNAEGRIFPWAEDALEAAETNPLDDGEVPEVLEDEKQVEKILALRPDLITALYSGLTQQQYDKFTDAGIPVVASPKGYVDYGTPWQEATTIIGKALGKEDLAEELVAGVDEKVAAAAAANPDFEGKTAATVSAYEGIFVYGSEDPRGRLLSDLGFVLPEDLDKFTKENFGKSISSENADMIDLDALIWVNSEKVALDGVKTYADLAAHKEGRDVFVSGDDPNDPVYIASSFVTVLSLPFYLEEIVPRLAAAVDGDPSTATD